MHKRRLKRKIHAHNKGKFFFFVGEIEKASKSDITFKGKDYNFTIIILTQDKPKVGILIM
jgi:hypothetical protein